MTVIWKPLHLNPDGRTLNTYLVGRKMHSAVVQGHFRLLLFKLIYG